MSRLNNTIRNIKYSVLAQSFNFLIVFATRKIFVEIFSAEYLGLNGVFSNILSMLTLAELGLGSAIAYCLYKPIYDDDRRKIVATMSFYKHAYAIIGTVVFVLGASLTPFLDSFVDEMPAIPYIRLIYLLFVLNSSLSYFFVYKKTLLIADQRRYITVALHQTAVLVMNLLQITLLLLTHNYFAYLLTMIFCTVAENVVVSYLADKQYPYLKQKNDAKLSKEERQEIFKNIRAMMAHRLGGVVVNSTDNLIMAKFVSVASVGIYSNYFLIKNTLMSLTAMIFQSVTASIGNLGADETQKERRKEIFDILNFAGSWLFGFMSICLFILYNPFITLWIGEKYLFSFDIVAVIVINFYMFGMRQAVLTSRDALGLFWYDRHKPIFESLINLIVSIPLGIKFGVFGVLLGTLASTMTTSFWVEPYVLYKHGFKQRSFIYFIKYIFYTLVTLIGGAVSLLLCSFTDDGYMGFGLKLVICAVVPNVIYFVCYFRTKEFHYIVSVLQNKVRIIKKMRLKEI